MIPNLETLLCPLPDVYILGAQRSGTTYLYDALSQHPHVAPAAAKELDFFTLDWEQGLEAYHRRLPVRWPRWMYAIAGRPRPLVMDATPYYLFHPEVPQRIAATVGPEAKFVVLLREPGARAWSHYHLALEQGREYLGFRSALDREAERLAAGHVPDPENALTSSFRSFSYTSRGFYAQQLKRWWAALPRERFLLLRSEDLYRNPQETLDRVCRFLSLQAVRLPEKINRNAATRAPLPADLRARLDDLFRLPNQELYELTGIGWTDSGRPSETEKSMAEAEVCS